ncbi:MAG: hypothetical protein RLZZ01_384, partial [Actinomycetota bacterium]
MKVGRRLAVTAASVGFVVVPCLALARDIGPSDTDTGAGLVSAGPLRSGLRITEQTWATAPGGTIRLVLDIVSNDLVPPTITTTTTTTTSTTSTTIDPADTPGGADDPVADDPDAGDPGIGDSTTDAVGSTTSTTTTTTVPVPTYRIQVRAHARLETRQRAVEALQGSHGLVIDLVEFDFDAEGLEILDDGTRRFTLDVPVTRGE